MSRKNEVFIQLPTEPSYWGSTATESDVSRICDNLESMIRAEFGERAVLNFERTATPNGQGVTCAHDDTAQNVWEWIANNWTAAL
jgi:hypothetical protein